MTSVIASHDYEQLGEAQVLEAKPELKKPPMYRIVMLNDDYTPMDFVVHVLMAFFQHDEASATKVMMDVHKKGSATAGIYPKDIAETKVYIVNEYSQEQEHPLQCDIEVIESDD